MASASRMRHYLLTSGLPAQYDGCDATDDGSRAWLHQGCRHPPAPRRQHPPACQQRLDGARVGQNVRAIRDPQPAEVAPVSAQVSPVSTQVAPVSPQVAGGGRELSLLQCGV